MAATQIQRVSIKHDAILDYLLIHPEQKLGDVAVAFGVSQPWLSVIIHSDAFQAKLGEKSGECFGATVLPLREQLMGVAQVGVEKLGECMENASTISDKQFIADTTDSILKNLGYSPKSAAPAQTGNNSTTNNNIFVVDKTALASAREKMRTVPNTELIEGEVLERTSEENGAPAQEV